MYIRAIDLINWRSYRKARFEFPRPHGDKNVVLVMAPNEYGKTSLFEAVTLGLFGRQGLTLVPRARTVGGKDTEDVLAVSYSRFLQGALHRRAVEFGPPQCVVALEWEDEIGDPIEIKRTWYFSAIGVHKIADDQLQIYEGSDRDPIYPPPAIPDKDNWYRDWISQRFLHPDLAEFFLFDGEQIQRYADREMSNQVRRGIEGLLGLPVLHNLKDSLDRYAQKRRTTTALPTDTKVKAVEEDIEKLEILIDKNTKECEEWNIRLPDLDSEIEDLTQRLGGRGEGTVALISSLLKDEHRHRDDAQRTMSNLTDLIAGDMALAIAGASLRDETITRLRAEGERETWEAGRNEGSRNLDRFITDLSKRVCRLGLPIDRDYHEAVIEAAKAAWEALWHPPPEGCADDYLHNGLIGSSRAATIDYLMSVGRHSATEASDHIARYNTAHATAEAKKRECLELQRIAPEIEEFTQRLKELSKQRGQYQEKRDAAQREISASTAELDGKRAELGRYMSSKNRAAPALLYAERADAYAKLIGDLLEEAVPFEVDEVANEMTNTWKAMAHMSNRLERISISPDCEVKMLTTDGEDLRQIDQSAGASQVFTQALITAITKVSGRIFPFIVDTPLARLSLEQRLGVLKTFTNRPGQVILLSTDQEVVGDKLDAIRDKISQVYGLKVTHDRGVAMTEVYELDLKSL